MTDTTPFVPDHELVGDVGSWVLPPSRTDGEPITFKGQYIGHGSSQKPTHINHDRNDGYAPAGVTCSGCRWFEARIFVRDNDDQYLVYTVGQTIVPNETPRYGYEWLVSPYEVIDKLTTVKYDPEANSEISTLSLAARRVLAQAAFYDDDLRQAYEGRLSTL